MFLEGGLADKKPDLLSLDGLVSWLEKQPADMTYDWHNCGGACLIGIYFAANGQAWNPRKYIEFTDFGTRTHIAGTKPYTFGAALDRARKALGRSS